MGFKARIALEKCVFSESKKTIVDFDNLKAFSFVYRSGVRAVKLQNEIGYIIVLPYKGQMIWDAAFDGRTLTMKSLFPEPRQASFFLDTYGNFLHHCGALRMGCPSSEDDHQLHGELPYADYERAFIEIGEDEMGTYLAISGVYDYNRAYGDKYTATPLVKLYNDSSVLDVSMQINNLTPNAMDLMYMCHINFAIARNAELIQSAGWNNKSMILRTSMPSHVTPSMNWSSLVKKIQKDVKVTKTIREDDRYDTDLVFFIGDMKEDEEGWAHFLQLHEDGSADIVSQKPIELDHHTRWILRNNNMEVLGMLPATCDPEGYTTEKQKGNVREIPPNGSVSFAIRVGSLNKEDAARLIHKTSNK